MTGKDELVPPEKVSAICRFGHLYSGAISLGGIRAVSPPYKKLDKRSEWAIDVFYNNTDKITLEGFNTLDDAVISANTIFDGWMALEQYEIDFKNYMSHLEYRATISRILKGEVIND